MIEVHFEETANFETGRPSDNHRSGPMTFDSSKSLLMLRSLETIFESCYNANVQREDRLGPDRIGHVGCRALVRIGATVTVLPCRRRGRLTGPHPPITLVTVLLTTHNQSPFCLLIGVHRACRGP
jgi:hypothetical protein